MPAEKAVAETREESVCDLDLDGCLHDLNGVWVMGSPDTNSVVGKGGVSGFEGGVDVAVAGSDVPVVAGQRIPVCQELECGGIANSVSVCRKA